MDTFLNRVIQSVNAFSMLQLEDGTVPVELSAIAEKSFNVLVDAVTRCPGQVGDCLRLVIPDLEKWRDAGFDEIPYFDETIANIDTARFSEGVAFLGVMRTPNSGRRGYALEVIVGQAVKDPLVEKVLEVFDDVPALPFPIKMTAGSMGFQHGECLVVFPENFRRRQPLANQPWAVFIVDRFATLYRPNTLGSLPLVHLAWRPVTAGCDLTRLEGLRQAFTVLHDREHQRGYRPLHQNLRLKSNHFCAVLDEVRVDIRTIRDAARLGSPTAEELAEIIYLDRVIRLPRVPAAFSYADSVAGILILSYLVSNGIDLRTVTCLDEIYPLLSSLADSLDQIEQLKDDRKYLSAAEEFVRSLVPDGSAVGYQHMLPPWLSRADVHLHWPGGRLSSAAVTSLSRLRFG